MPSEQSEIEVGLVDGRTFRMEGGSFGTTSVGNEKSWQIQNGTHNLFFKYDFVAYIGRSSEFNLQQINLEDA